MNISYNKEDHTEGSQIAFLSDIMQSIRQNIDNREPIFLTMEPGDGTRYEFAFFLTDTRRLAACILGGDNCVVVVNRGEVHWGYIWEKINRPSMNKWTVSLFADVINQINKSDLAYYDYVKSAPVNGGSRKGLSESRDT